MMSFYLILILALLLGEYALDTTAEVLNLRRIKFQNQIPSEFVGIYDPEKYSKSLDYLRTNTRFGLIRSLIMLILILAFLLLGGFGWVDELARSLASSTIWTALLFVGILALLRSIVQLPFSFYDTFVIEQKFGFNRTTFKTYILDLIKFATLTALLGGPIFALIVYFFEKVGPWAWLYSWLAVTVIQLILVFLAPVVIMPLFNRFEPLPEGELKDAIRTYSESQNFQIQGIYTMDSSKRSSKTNAFFTGFGKFRRLVFFDTLLKNHGCEELVAILAHEIGHYKRKHIPKFTMISIVSSGTLFYVMSLLINNPDLSAAFGVATPSVYASLVFVGFLYSPAMRFFSVLTQSLSRKFEFEADEYSVRTYRKAEILIAALKKLSVDNLSYLTPHPLKVLLDYSHPPILKRIEAIRSRAKLV